MVRCRKYQTCLCVGCFNLNEPRTPLNNVSQAGTYILDHSLSGLFILRKGGCIMRNYWYVSLTNRYPQPNTDDPVRVVQSVQIKKKYSIIEMTREATPKEVDKYNLRYCGHGYFSEQNIQTNIKKYH